ncbi:MAG: hypothetical protein Kow0037_11160 [Calditrichia bacterium]
MNFSIYKNSFGQRILLTIILTIVIAVAGHAYTPQPGTPLANHEHPRLHITQALIPEMRQIIASEYAAKFQAYVNWAASQGVNSEDNNIDIVRGSRIFEPAMVNHAFIAALGQVPGINYPITLDEFAQRAISRLEACLSEGQLLGYPGILVYDWTFNYMTAPQRQNIANQMKTRKLPNRQNEDNYSIANPSMTIESMYSSDYYSAIYAFYAGLALWGDGYCDVEADNAVNTFYDQMLNYGFADAQNMVSGYDGGWSEWYSNYAMYRISHFMLLDGWYTATGENYLTELYGKIPGSPFKNHGAFLYYLVDPFKYRGTEHTFISMGGGGGEDAHSFDYTQIYGYHFPFRLFKLGATQEAGLLRSFVEEYEVEWFNYNKEELSGYLGLLKGVPKVTPEQFGLPKYNWMKNFGVFVARTGFHSQADEIFTVQDGHFNFAGHAGADDYPGFTLNKLGELVNKRKAGHRHYGNLSDYPGAYRYNVVFFDNEHLRDVPGIADPNDLQQAWTGQGGYDRGGIEQVTAREDVFYHVRVNRSLGFTDNVTHTREYLWLPGAQPDTDPEFLVIYDRTSSPSTPNWVYHTPWEPDASGYSSTQSLTTGSGTTDRIGTSYVGSEIILKELSATGEEKDGCDCQCNNTGGAGSHGVAFFKTLLPAVVDVQVTRVADFDQNTCHRQGDYSLKTHRWQVNVRPTMTNNQHRFLSVFETGDANLLTSMHNTSHFEAGNFDGIWIDRPDKDAVALFYKEDNVYSGNISFSVNLSGDTRFVVAGLEPATQYTVKNLSSGQTLQVNPESNVERWDYKGAAPNHASGVIYFESSGNGTTQFEIINTGQTGAIEDPNILPDKIRLYQNFPNPFNPETTIRFSLPESIKVRLEVYNPAGQLIATLVDENLPAGEHKVTWHAEKNPSGIYFYKLTAGQQRSIKKMLLLR